MEPAGRVGAKLGAEVGLFEVAHPRRRLDLLAGTVGELFEPVLELLDAVRARPVVFLRPAAGGEKERGDEEDEARHAP
jgi:hypothetical protein